MYRKGHWGAALLFYAPVGFVLLGRDRPRIALVGGAVALWLAKVPDFDRRLPLVDHRGITHTVWFALAVGGCLGAAGYVAGDAGTVGGRTLLTATGAAVGALTVLSHVAADALIPMGVWPFWPLPGEYALGWVRAKNRLANLGLLALGAAAVGAVALFGPGGLR